MTFFFLFLLNMATSKKQEKGNSSSNKSSNTQALKAEKVNTTGIRKGTGLKPSTIERFLSYVKQGKGCWEWQGSFTNDGYGQFWIEGNKVVKTHRLAYELFRGKLPKEKRLKNNCGDKKCVNPEHWAITNH